MKWEDIVFSFHSLLLVIFKKKKFSEQILKQNTTENNKIYVLQGPQIHENNCITYTIISIIYTICTYMFQ